PQWRERETALRSHSYRIQAVVRGGVMWTVFRRPRGNYTGHDQLVPSLASPYSDKESTSRLPASFSRLPRGFCHAPDFSPPGPIARAGAADTSHLSRRHGGGRGGRGAGRLPPRAATASLSARLSLSRGTAAGRRRS